MPIKLLDGRMLDSAGKLIINECLATSITGTNINCTNSTFTNTTGTNCTFNNVNGTNSVFTNINGTNSTFTNIVNTNSTLTNITGTNLYLDGTLTVSDASSVIGLSSKVITTEYITNTYSVTISSLSGDFIQLSADNLYVDGNIYIDNVLKNTNWDVAFTTVQANSASWATDSTVDTGVRALTGNWENTFVTVSSLSANWNRAFNISTEYQNASSSFATNIVPVNIQAGTTYTIRLSDAGGTIGSTNAGAGLTATLVGAYPTGFQTSIIQLNTARVTLSGQDITINNADGFFKTTKQYSAATLIYTGAVGGWVLFGDLNA